MKLFWAFILALTAFTAGLFYARHSGGATTPAEPPTPSAPRGQATPAPTGFVPLRRPSRDESPTPLDEAAGARDHEPAAPALDLTPDDPRIPDPVPIDPRPSAQAPTVEPNHAPTPASATTIAWSDDRQAVSDLLNTLLKVDPSTVPDTIAAATPATDASASGDADSASPDPNRFTFEGAGTPDDPYIVPWEALVSARDTYRPRKGKRDIPPWVEQLNGKTVLLNGYLLLPIMQTNTKEVLLMRNQWDGCCIGVPPTPYDAIEIKLTKSTKELSRTRMNYGAIQGTLKVDPYLVKDWLVGLYLMEDGELRDIGF